MLNQPTNHPDPELLAQVEDGIKKQVEAVAKLAETASKHPYYKYVWIQDFQTRWLEANGVPQVQLQVDSDGSGFHLYGGPLCLAGWSRQCDQTRRCRSTPDHRRYWGGLPGYISLIFAASICHTLFVSGLRAGY